MHSLRSMSRTVLVVDDDVDLRAALEEVLVDAGYEPVLARSAEHALEVLKTIARPCLVLLDYTMPGAGADGFLSAIEALADAQSFAVVLMTGMRGSEVRSGNRIAARLCKPFEREALLAILEAHCGTPRSPAVAS